MALNLFKTLKRTVIGLMGGASLLAMTSGAAQAQSRINLFAQDMGAGIEGGFLTGLDKDSALTHRAMFNPTSLQYDTSGMFATVQTEDTVAAAPAVETPLITAAIPAKMQDRLPSIITEGASAALPEAAPQSNVLAYANPDAAPVAATRDTALARATDYVTNTPRSQYTRRDLRLVQAAVKGDAQDIKDLAIRALWTWKNPELARDLLKVAADMGNRQAKRDLVIVNRDFQQLRALAAANPAPAVAAPVARAPVTRAPVTRARAHVAAPRTAETPVRRARTQPVRVASLDPSAGVSTTPNVMDNPAPRPATRRAAAVAAPSQTPAATCTVRGNFNRESINCVSARPMIGPNEHVLVQYRGTNSRSDFQISNEDSGKVATRAFTAAVMKSRPWSTYSEQRAARVEAQAQPKPFFGLF